VPLLQKQDLDHRQGRIARRASDRSMDRGKQALERRPVERLIDPIQKSPALPAAAPIASTNDGWERSRRDIGESSSLAHPQRIKSAPLLQSSLDFWSRELEGLLHSVTVAHARLIKPAKMLAIDGEFMCATDRANREMQRARRSADAANAPFALLRQARITGHTRPHLNRFEVAHRLDNQRGFLVHDSASLIVGRANRGAMLIGGDQAIF
jgi:hypothetical protein